MTEHGHLLIIGAPKAASTSVYRYLSDHPDVCPSSVKETYFFARDFDDKGVCRVGTSPADFETYFPGAHDNGQLRLEATPYTLYSHGAAQLVARTLPDTRLLAMLRDPVERLVSEYRFRVQRGEFDASDRSFAQYVDHLYETPDELANPLIVGHYAQFLGEFVEVFGRDRLTIGFHEELIADPAREMQRLASKVGLDPVLYRDYSFEVHNRTVGVRSRRLGGIRVWLEPRVSHIRSRVADNARSAAALNRVVQIGARAIDRVNAGPPTQITIEPALRLQLKDYYRSHDAELEALLGRSVPWASRGVPDDDSSAQDAHESSD